MARIEKSELVRRALEILKTEVSDSRPQIQSTLPDAPACLVGTQVWYQIPGSPEKGPCRVTSLNDLGWNMVKIVENGKWVWVHRSLITRVQPAEDGMR